MNPYRELPPDRFWKTAVWEAGARGAPVVAKTMRIEPDARVATAGSCFAQSIARHMQSSPHLEFYCPEQPRADEPLFSARFGNIYTARQLLDLFEDAMSGTLSPACAKQRADGRFVDAHRPLIAPEGYASADEVLAARAEHLIAVRRMFHQTDVFVFTMGLTEAWCDAASGRAYPMPPQLYVADPDDADVVWHNFEVHEITAQMTKFLDGLFAVNPKVRVLLTVSPVPVTATYSGDHVMVASTLTKATLRVAASQLAARDDAVYYVPTYEMIANPFCADTPYDPDNLRTVQAARVAEVMAMFDTHWTTAGRPANPVLDETDEICDDVELESSIGF